MDIFYRWLIFFIHKTILIVNQVIENVMVLYWYFKQFHLSGFSLMPEDILKRTKTRISYFEKLPTHIGIVINEDVICLHQIANIIVWCLALDIPHLSVYDCHGLLKSSGVTLYKNTVKCREKFFKKHSDKFKVTFHNAENGEIKNGTTNGHLYDSELQVSLLSCRDGKQGIVNAAKKICREVEERFLDPSDITKTKLNMYLKALMKSPDPDLILCFGRGSSLVGYLPWHVHLSEIVFQPSHRTFQLSQFLNALEKYNFCQQRFGK